MIEPSEHDRHAELIEAKIMSALAGLPRSKAMNGAPALRENRRAQGNGALFVLADTRDRDVRPFLQLGDHELVIRLVEPQQRIVISRFHR